MDKIGRVVRYSRRLERLLREHYHAEGKGLHQLVTSCEQRLPHDAIGQLRFVATVRNKAVHQDGYEIDDIKGYEKTCRQLETKLVPRAGKRIWWLTFGLIFLFTAMAMAFYVLYWGLFIEH
ncbi:DUF4145 domain-containing protein [Veronia pacifica]|uniref:DUF4145 domain-containing protein n=1 Tax=Veronia pacifica TaxID=1080227 RepID=A0A1C3EJB8_9GAMM|nr:DUF4145 domain-containing protein [Veronia pacifica]ODA33319.1 DUF4145 domain-containing protein [Veronia pacifica]